MPDKASVFISYSRRDRAFGEALHAAFEREGRVAWLDTEDIRPTAKWSNEIATAIDGSDAIVFVLSPDFAASNECAKEIEHAARQNKRLIPVVARPVEPRAAPPLLAELQWVSFVDPARFDAAFQILNEAVDTDLGWVTEHTRYHVRAVEWDTSGRSSSLVLRGKELKQAEKWLAEGGTRKPQPSLLQSQYVAAGRHAATRRQRIMAAALTTGLVTAIALAIFAFIQRNAAREARDEAVHRLYTLQLSRATDLVNRDPDGARDVLDDTLRTAGGLREFTWDLFRRLSNRTLLALGGMWNTSDAVSDEFYPIVALSSDGRMLATASVRQAKRGQYSPNRFVAEVLVWDVDTGARRAAFTLREGDNKNDMTVMAISFASNGRQLAASAGSYASVLKVWDLATGSELLSKESRSIRFAWLASGQLVGVQEFGEIHVWDATNPNAPPRILKGAPTGATTLGKGGAYLYTLQPREAVRWNIATGGRSTRPNPAGILSQSDISADGKRIARVDSDSISVWRSAANDSNWNLEWILTGGHAEIVTSMGFSPDGRTLASGGNDNTVRLWDLERGLATMTLRGPKGAIHTLIFSEDGRRLAAGGADATVFVWDIDGVPERPASQVEVAGKSECFQFSPAGQSIQVTPEGRVHLRTPTGEARELGSVGGKGPHQCGISQSGDTAFYVDGSSRIELWNVSDQKPHAINASLNDPQSVRLSPNADLVAAFVAPNRIGLWNARSGESAGTIEADGTLGYPFDFVDDTVLAGYVRRDDGTHATLWETNQRKALTTLKINDGSPKAFSHCRAQRLFATAENEKLRILNFGASASVQDIDWYDRRWFSVEHHPLTLAFSPDCSTLAIGDDVGEISELDVKTGQRRFSIKAHSGLVVAEQRSVGTIGVSTKSTSDGVTALMFSPDGRTIASGGGSRRSRSELRLWSADRGDLLAELSGANGLVTALTFSLDGTALCFVVELQPDYADRPMRLLEQWTTRTAQELALIAAHTSPVTRVKFSPDGTRLLTEAEGEAKVWDVSTKETVDTPRFSIPGVSNWMSEKETADGKTARYPDNRLRVEFSDRDLLLYRNAPGDPQVLRATDEPYFHSQPIQSIHMLRDGKLISLAMGSQRSGRAAEIDLWDLDAGKPVREAYEPANTVTGLVLSPDERSFVTTGAVGGVLDHPGLVHIWDARDLRQIGALTGHRARVQAAAFSADGKLLATGDIEGFVRIWDFTKIVSLR